ncbi:MAG: hypothetical protein ACRD35_02755 [Candidatus Acidiferrales bacterium]
MTDAAPNPWRELEALEETVRRAVAELSSLGEQRDLARAEAESLRTALAESHARLENLEAKLAEFEEERGQVRRRIEQLMTQIDSLTEAEP